jgi:hypothetical protein
MSALAQYWNLPHKLQASVTGRPFLEHLNGVTHLLNDESGEFLAHPSFRLIPQGLSERRIGKP